MPKKPEASPSGINALVVPDGVVPHQEVASDVWFYLDSLSSQEKPDTGVFYRHFEERYAEALSHYRRLEQPRPDKDADPEAFESWMISREYWYALAEEDLRTAMIVKRIATPIHKKVNANQPEPPLRVNRNDFEVDQYGAIPGMRGESLEEEIAKLEKEAMAVSGIAVPLNQFEVTDIIELIKDAIANYQSSIAVQDILLQARDGGEAFTRDGREVYLEPNLEMQEEFNATVNEVKSRTEQLQTIRERYETLLVLGRLAIR